MLYSQIMVNDMTPDILSSTLIRMKLKNSAAGAIDGKGHFAIEVPEHEGIKLYLYLKGDAWISSAGGKSKIHVEEGGCVLMTSSKSSVVSSSSTPKKAIKLESILKTAKNGVMTINGGGDSFSIGIHFQFEGPFSKLLFAHLPPVIYIPGHVDQSAVLRWTIERFRAESFSAHLGRSLILNHLAPIILLQILRIYLDSAKSEQNWLVALSDPKLSKAIEAIHAEYQKSWSLEDLAKVAGMSRSGFALNFKNQVGISPMEYLINWRIQIACELLSSTEHNVAAVAEAVGYKSESAFSIAFKRIVKCRPGFYQKNFEKLNSQNIK